MRNTKTNKYLAALEAAERLVSLNWLLQCAVLRLEESESSNNIQMSSMLVGGLSIISRNLVGSVIEKDRLRDEILAVWTNSEFGCANESSIRWAAFWKGLTHQHEVANRKLAVLRNNCDAFLETHDEEAKQIVQSCVQLIRSIEAIIEGSMSERQRRIFRLGRKVAELIHPPDVYKGTRGWSDPARDGPEGVAQELLFSAYDPRPFVHSLPASWDREVQDRLVECGFRLTIPEAMMWARYYKLTFEEKQGAIKEFQNMIRQEFLMSDRPAPTDPGCSDRVGDGPAPHRDEVSSVDVRQPKRDGGGTIDTNPNISRKKYTNLMQSRMQVDPKRP
jgi:hypothetical protein